MFEGALPPQQTGNIFSAGNRPTGEVIAIVFIDLQTGTHHGNGGGQLVVGVKNRRGHAANVGIIFTVIEAPAAGADTPQLIAKLLGAGDGGWRRPLPLQLADNRLLNPLGLPGQQAFTNTGTIQRQALTLVRTHADGRRGFNLQNVVGVAAVDNAQVAE